MESQRSLWFLVSGPSGVGKTTLIAQMLYNYAPQLLPVVTATTREKRPGEEDGKQYFFLNQEEFEKREKEGKFLETIERHGARYATVKEEIKKKLEEGTDLIMHIDWQGRRHLETMARGESWLKRSIVSIFMLPESLTALKQRLEIRGRNTPEEIARRMQEAEEDLKHAQEYDYAFKSGSYDQDLQLMKAIYMAEKARACRP